MNAVVYSLLAIALLSVSMGAIPTKDCGSTASKLTKFEVSDCATSPCVFHKNTNVTVTIEAQFDADHTSLKNVVYGQIAGVPVPFPLPQSDVCSNGVTCPVKATTTISQSITIPVLSVYPSVISLLFCCSYNRSHLLINLSFF